MFNPEKEPPQGKKKKNQNKRKPMKFLATERGLVVDSPKGREFTDKVERETKNMSFEKVAEMISPAISRIEEDLKQITECLEDCLKDPEETEREYPKLIDSLRERKQEKEAQLLHANEMKSRMTRDGSLTSNELNEILSYLGKSEEERKRREETETLLSSSKGPEEERKREEETKRRKVMNWAAETFISRKRGEAEEKREAE